MEWKLKKGRYVLAVQNLKISVDYYKRKLGFETYWEGDGWHFLKNDQIYIMLGECPDDRSASETRNHSYFAYIDVTQIDALHHSYLSNNVDIIHPLQDKPWGQREFGIRTVDGHRIMFGETLNN